ncbi:tRNA 2-thiocytidine biosynthesis protein TtcA, partial [Stegodyphus mimosarum]
MALRKFTADQHLMFDGDSSCIRWFLLPSEAKRYLLGELQNPIKNPVFLIRSGRGLHPNENFNQMPEIFNNIEDENGNNTDLNVTPVTENVNCTSKIKGNNCALLSPNLKRIVHLDLIRCRWKSPPASIFRPFLKALEAFHMIMNGDRILVCISGGKDSLSLVHTLHQYQFYAKKKGVYFDLGCMTVDPKSPSYDPSPLKDYFNALDIPYFYEEQEILNQALNIEKCKSICSFCSRLKRGRIYACARRENYNVIALGQHLDDLAESFLMSAFHNGRLRTMKAHYTDKSSSVRIIRPFVYVREKDLRRFAEEKKLPVIPENCPACFEAPKERHRMKQLLAAQEIMFPSLYLSLRTAMLPLMAVNITGAENRLFGKYSIRHLLNDRTES